MSISKILKNTSISSQTTGYRIINDLIKDGLLVESGYDFTPDGKRRQAYVTPIKKINITVRERSLDVAVELAEEFVGKSGFLNTVFTKTNQ